MVGGTVGRKGRREQHSGDGSRNIQPTSALPGAPRLDPPRNLLEFSRRFTSECACEEYLFAARYPAGFICPKCGSRRGWFLQSFKLVECPNGHKASLTAGTVMHRTKQDLVTWFHAAYLVTTLTPGVSALQFQRQMGLSRYETAFHMLHKLRAALVAPGRESLHGEVEVDEAYFGGGEEGRPGRGSETKSLVVCAVELVRWTEAKSRKERVRTGRVRLRVVPDASAASLVPFVKDSVQIGTIVYTDGWLGYSTLRAKGYDHRPVIQGTGKEARYMPHVHRIFSNLKGWLLGTHHGRVTAKHLQAYLNEYTFRFNRRFWRGLAFHRALGLAVHTEDHPTYDTLHRAGEDGGWVHPSPSGSSEPDDGTFCGQQTRARPTLPKSTG